MRVKYQRTSTSQQHGNRFKEDQDKYDLVLFDKGVSGTLPFMERTEASKIAALVEDEKLKELVIEEIRDIGRNMRDSINTLGWLDDNKVNVHIRSMGISSRVDGKKNKIWGMITATMSSLYEQELEHLKIRTKAGRDAFVRNGGRLGRKKGTTQSVQQFLKRHADVISLLDKGKSVRDISSRLSKSYNTVVKVRKHYLPEEQHRKEVIVNYNGIKQPIATYIKQKRLKPIVKWVGGKERELKNILPELPQKFTNYYEPFVGGGSVYTAVNADNYLINDKSDELVRLYKALGSDQKPKLIKNLTEISSSWNNLNNLFDENISFFEVECEKYLSGKIKKSQLVNEIYDFVLENSIDFLELTEEIGDKRFGNFLVEIKNSLADKLGRIKKLNDSNKKGLPILETIETAIKGAFYNHIRNIYNKRKEFGVEQELTAALFFFIREFAFSGMFRYDSQGNFNISYAGKSYNRKSLTDKIEYLNSCVLEELLAKTTIDSLDGVAFLKKSKPEKSDFIFLDPPYNEAFSGYSNNIFDENDHKRLADYLIHDCEAQWMLVIKNTALIKKLFSDTSLSIEPFTKKYSVNIKGRNVKKVEHLLIKNYG